MYPLPTLLTPLPLTPFASKETKDCTVSVTPSINTPESSSGFIILKDHSYLYSK